MKDGNIFKYGIGGTFELCGELIDAEESDTVGNSFFDRSYFGTRILILAPTPGDEIAIAGNTILNFSSARAEIFVAFSASGDSKILRKESLNALKILGVKPEKIIFIDAKENLKSELKNLISELQADIIFCADFDSLPEPGILSLTFEEVAGEIFSENPDYRPEIYKKFAYAAGISAPPDFYAPNLLETKSPKIGVTDNYDFDFIGKGNFVWENRVRFPVNEHCRQALLKNNPVAAAIFAYKSRKKILSAARILNSDEIFFYRRTDNLIFSAELSATSGNVEKIRDFKIIDTSDKKNFPAKIENHVWQPAKNDSRKKISVNFPEPVQIRRVTVYGNVFDEEPAKLNFRFVTDNPRPVIDKSGIYSDNIHEFKMNLPEHGRPAIFDTEKIFARSVEISAERAGKNFGISELEFFSNPEPRRTVSPFIKLTTGKNFFYRYFVPYEFEKIPVGVYRFRVDEPVKITAESNDKIFLREVLTGDEELILNFGNAEEIILTAEVVGNPNIYDKATVRRVGDAEQIQFKIWQWIDKVRSLKLS